MVLSGKNCTNIRQCLLSDPPFGPTYTSLEPSSGLNHWADLTVLQSSIHTAYRLIHRRAAASARARHLDPNAEEALHHRESNPCSSVRPFARSYVGSLLRSDSKYVV